MIEAALNSNRPDDAVRDIGLTLEVRDSTRKTGGTG